VRAGRVRLRLGPYAHDIAAVGVNEVPGWCTQMIAAC
jgi:hypothetical protein